MRKLFQHPLCPYGRQVRLALSEKKLDFALERESQLKDQTVIRTWPVLQDLNGVFLSHPYAIVEYLEEVYPENELLPPDSLAKTEARSIVGWINDIFGRDISATLIHEKYGKRVSRQGVPDSSVIRNAKSQLNNYLDALNNLIDRRHWLAGEAMTYADLAAASHLSIVDYFGDVPWDKFSVIKDWYVRLKSRPSFRGLLAERIPGLPPADHYDNLDF